MREGPDIAEIAALIGDPARAAMLGALMNGLALTAGELAREAGITPQTASAHLTRMTDAGLMIVEVQGRHRYFRLAGSPVAEGLEALMGMAVRLNRLRTRPGPKDAALRYARICYDHLAGDLGTAAYEALVARGDITITVAGLALSAPGRARFVAEGIDLDSLEARKRQICRACLDWSSRRHHLGGALGAAITTHILTLKWASRRSGQRHIDFTPTGLRAFQQFVGIATSASKHRGLA